MRNANVALLQLCSGDQVRDNLAQIEQQIKQLNAGVKLVMTPENALLFANSAAYRQQAEKQGDGPLQNAVRELARRYGVWLLVGSMPLISRENPELITTSSLLFDDQGEIAPATTSCTCSMWTSTTRTPTTASRIPTSTGSI